MRKSKVTGIIGLGYVGLPLLLDFCDAGIKTIGFDLDQKKIVLMAMVKSAKMATKSRPQKVGKAGKLRLTP